MLDIWFKSKYGSATWIERDWQQHQFELLEISLLYYIMLLIAVSCCCWVECSEESLSYCYDLCMGGIQLIQGSLWSMELTSARSLEDWHFDCVMQVLSWYMISESAKYSVSFPNFSISSLCNIHDTTQHSCSTIPYYITSYPTLVNLYCGPRSCINIPSAQKRKFINVIWVVMDYLYANSNHYKV